jgi:hypothetical protein
VGAPKTILEEHGDALYDFALSVTGNADRAVAAVREAVPAALEQYGPGLSPSMLFGSVFAVAVRDAMPPTPLGADLIEPGSGSPDELQRLARSATALLDPVQRGCLDLALRQGLEGEALSEALGVAPGLASVSVQAATDQAEHVIGAVLLSRVARADCPGLDGTALESVGLAAEKLAAGVVEHGEECPACGDRLRALVPVTTLLAGVPPQAAPPEMKQVDPRRPIWQGGSGIVRALRPPTPRVEVRPGRPWRRGLGGAVAVIAVLVVAVAILWPRHSGEIAPAAAPGGQLVVDTNPLDFGTVWQQGGIRVTNSGREPLVFETRAGVGWISFAGGEGTLDPGASVVVSALLDRLQAPEGAADTEIRIQSNGGSAVVPVRAVVERAPEVSSVEVIPQSVVVRRCPGSTPAQVRAAVVEESALESVQLHWTRPGRVEQISPMSGEAASSFEGTLGPFDTTGDVRWWVSAVDIRQNRSVSPPQVLRVGSC